MYNRRAKGWMMLLLGLAASTPALAREAALFDELAVLFPDTDIKQGHSRYTIDTPRGVPAGVHVLVTGLSPREQLRWTLDGGNQPVREARAYRLVDVPVEQNTGIASRTEAWDGKQNPHVVRDAPFRVFEVLEPVGRTTQANTNGVLALRVEVPISPGAKPTSHRWTLSLRAGDWQQTLHWHVRVHPVTVPPTGPRSPGYTNWFNPGLIARRHDLEPWTEPFWKMLSRYADLMARGRQNTFWIRWNDFLKLQKSDGDVPNRITLDTARLERYINIFLERGFTRIEGGQLAGRHQGDWSSPRLDLNLTGTDATTDKGRAELAQIATRIREALADLNLPQHIRYLQHIADEPTDTNAEAYALIAAQLRRHMPGVPIFEATMSRELVGAVDHWCPQVKAYQDHRDFFEHRKRAGDTVWVYTCLSPGGPWLNRLLDQQRVRPVYLGWALVKYDLGGFLHWGLNHYRPNVDPFEQSVVPHGKGAPNFLPAGDSHVVYPGDGAPWSGQRFEAHRIGMEDAELLRILQARNPRQADAIIERVLRAFDDYETEVSAYREARSALLTAIAKQDAKERRAATETEDD